MKDFCSRIRENSGVFGIAQKSHDFSYHGNGTLSNAEAAKFGYTVSSNTSHKGVLMSSLNRRKFVQTTIGVGAACAAGFQLGETMADETEPGSKMRLGLVTYLWGKDMDLPASSTRPGSNWRVNSSISTSGRPAGDLFGASSPLRKKRACPIATTEKEHKDGENGLSATRR